MLAVNLLLLRYLDVMDCWSMHLGLVVVMHRRIQIHMITFYQLWLWVRIEYGHTLAVLIWRRRWWWRS